MLIGVDGQTAMWLLRIYGISAPVSAEDVRTLDGADDAIPVTIDGLVDPQSGPNIRLKIAKRRAQRTCPVTEHEAQAIVSEFHAANILKDQSHDSTLIAMMAKCSKLFTQSGLGELHLLLYLTPQGYRTHATYMLRSRVVKKRLISQTHDAAAVYEKDVLTNRS